MAHRASPEAARGRRPPQRRRVQGCAPPRPLESPISPRTAPPTPGQRTGAVCPTAPDPPHQQAKGRWRLEERCVLSTAARPPKPCLRAALQNLHATEARTRCWCAARFPMDNRMHSRSGAFLIRWIRQQTAASPLCMGSTGCST